MKILFYFIKIEFFFCSDLLKCCHRLSTLSISLSIHRQLAFYDILDCFAAFLPKVNRLQIIQTIGTLFNMNNQEVRINYCFHQFVVSFFFLRQNFMHLNQYKNLMIVINNILQLDMLN